MAVGHQRILPGVAGNLVIPDLDCQITVYVGAAVRIQETGLVVNALANSIDNSDAVGMCVSKSATDKCTIRIGGATDDIFTGLTKGRNYFLSPTVSGGIQLTPATGTGRVWLKIGKAITDKRLNVNIGRRIERS